MNQLKVITDIEKDYEIHELSIIKDDFVGFLNDCEDSKERFDGLFPDNSSTWLYYAYNIFNLTSGSLRFYKLFNELKKIARGFLKTDEPLWMQSWLNHHNMDEVLDWHTHSNCSAHGYVSINPMKTKTVFEDFEVENQIGKLYIGKPHKQHRVEILEKYHLPRITIAFDVLTVDDYKLSKQQSGNKINLSPIPI